MNKKDIKVIVGSFVAFLVSGWLIWLTSSKTNRGYGVESLQPVFITITVGWLLLISAIWMLSFKFKTLKEYMYSNDSKIDFNSLKPIEKICITLFSLLALLLFLASIFKAIR
jgi:hypothetical protein